MRISVVTAALNCRQELIRTRDSLLRQRGVEIQHIVVDGGSTDGTRELLAEWATDENFRFVSETDSGVYDAFNKGLRLADGDCVGFLNAGDVYEDDCVLSEVRNVLSDNGIDMVFGDVEITRPHTVDQTIRRYRAAGFAGEHLLRGFMPPHPSLYARTSLYQTVGHFREDFRIAGDFEWVIRAFLRHDVAAHYIDRVFVRMPAGGLSNRGFSSIWRITLEMHRALSMNELPASWFKLVMRLPFKWLQA